MNKFSWQSAINLLASLFTLGQIAIGGRVIIFLAALGAAVWQPVSNYMQATVIATIAADLDKGDQSKLLRQIKSEMIKDLTSKKGDLSEQIGQIYDSKMAERFDKMYGELTLGYFTLTDDDKENYIYVFDPPARNGTILLQIEDLPAGRQLILQCPKGRPLPLAVSAEYAVSVLSNSIYIGPNGSGKEDPALQPIDPESKYLKGLYKVTVKLVPSVIFTLQV